MHNDMKKKYPLSWHYIDSDSIDMHQALKSRKCMVKHSLPNERKIKGADIKKRLLYWEARGVVSQTERERLKKYGTIQEQ